MKKRTLSTLLSLLLLLLGAAAFAEGTPEEVGAAAAVNSIQFVSIDEVAWDHVTYTVRISVTDQLAEEGYRIGLEYSPDQDFSQRAFQFKDTFGSPSTEDHLYHQDNWETRITRHVVSLIPDHPYYFRPGLYSSDIQSFEPITSGQVMSAAGPVGDADYTNMALNVPVAPADYPEGMIHAKFTPSVAGQYALVGNEDMEFISYCFPDGYTADRQWSVYTDHGDGSTSSRVMTVFMRLEAGQTVYVFGKRADYAVGRGALTVVRGADAAPSENSIEAGDPFNVTNITASFNCTVSTTEETAQNGYQVGLIYGDHGTDPESWQGRVKIYMPEYVIKSLATTTYRNNGVFAPGMDVDYQAALFDLQTGAVLARGSYIGRLRTPDNVDGLTELTKGITYSWNNPGMKYFYYTAAEDGMLAVSGSGMNPLRLTDGANRDLGSGSLIGSYLKKGERFYPVAYNNAGVDCTVTVRDGLEVFRSVGISDGTSQVLNETTPVRFRAPEAGCYRFAIDGNSPADLLMVNEDGRWQHMGKEFLAGLEKDQDLWLRRTPGDGSSPGLTVEAVDANVTSDLDLNGLGSFRITKNTTVAEGAEVTFYGTELVIDPGVTLEIRGRAFGDSVSNSGTLRISGETAAFRTGERLTMSSTGHMEVDGHAYVELASSSPENNSCLNPLMDMRFTNGGSVTFGYFIPSEDYMRSLLARLDNSNPNIRLDLQFFCGINLSQDLTLPEHVTLHTDTYWSQGQSFTIPQGVTLTIPESNAFYSFGTAIDIQGNLINNGEVSLGASGDGSNGPMILNMSLAAGGNYSGGGVVTIQTLDNPLSYMDGFSSYRFEEVWRDETNNMVSYRLFRTYDFRENGQGSYTLPGDLTVNPFERLLADELIIPYGVTLTMYGDASIGTALVIQQGGALVIDNNGRVDLYGPPSSTDVAGSILLLNYSELNMSLGHWTNSNIKNAIQVAGEGSVINVGLEIRANNQSGWTDVLHNVMAQNDIPVALQGFVHKECTLCVPYTPTQDFAIPAGIDFRVLNNGSDETGSLAIPQGVTLTIPENGYLGLCASDLTVYGAIANNGRVELMTRSGGPDGILPVFTMTEGADYTGNGEIWVRSFQREPSQSLVGFTNGVLFMVNRDAMGGQYRYIANKTSDNILVLPQSTRIIEEEAFAGTAAQEIQLPAAIESIGARAFADADSLELVVIPVKDLEIDPTAFAGSDNVVITAPADGSVQTFAARYQIPFMPLSGD